MIFYFSGTGNSYRAATTLTAALGEERMIAIADAVADGAFGYRLTAGEPLGFVFPVYCYSLPQTVTDFLAHLQLTGAADPYVFAVITCGECTGNAAGVLTGRLKSLDLKISASFGLVMPNNSIPWYPADTGVQADRIRRAADVRLADIAAAVKTRQTVEDRSTTGKMPGLHTALAARSYQKDRRTSHFSVAPFCTGCGRCAEVCPDRIIKSKTNGSPEWTAPQCSLCLACMNRCPNQSILYDGSAGRGGQWFDPEYRSFLRNR
jgi:ferredoxin/predicted metal-binding protein